MIDCNFSCIKEETKVVQIILPAAFTSNEINGVSEILESWKRQYIQQLKAVVVSYKNISLTSVCGFIKLDCPFVNCNVRATFELFYPTVGSTVKGKINRISHDYIGCLVHNTINVTIDRPANLSDIVNFIALDRFILFKITSLDFKRKIIHVKGKITEECINLMREVDLLNSTDNVIEGEELTSTPSFNNESLNNHKGLKRKMDAFNKNSISEDTTSTDSGHHSPKQKKSKKSHDYSSDTSSQLSSPRKKKQHKKSKSEYITSPPLFSESQDSEVNEIEPTQPSEMTSKEKHNLRFEPATLMNQNNVDSLPSVKSEILTDSSSQKSPKKKPKTSSTTSPEKKMLPNSAFPQNDTSSVEEDRTQGFNTLLSPSKKKKHKKSKENLSKSPKKKHKKTKSESQHSKNGDSFFKIKKENETDSPTKTNKSFNISDTNYTDVYAMMEALSSFEPSAEDQLLGTTKKEPLDAAKKGKKRKHDSSTDVSSQPKKKRKIKKESSSNKSEEKLDKKEKSKKNSKKDKKKKSKDKVISTKKPKGYKIKLNKKKKKEKAKSSKSRKEKKSVNHKTKNVPSLISVKSEEN